jgi:GDP-4-dehydro-6-deoxy-D-mannose reductase
MRALITGATGFVGPYLVKLLLSQGYSLCGTYFDAPSDCSDFADIRLEKVDVTDEAAVKRVISNFLPDEIYHLAGAAVTSGISKETYYKINFGGTIAVLDAVREIVPNSRVLVVGSAVSYGKVPEECQPIKEEREFRPINHYAASKAAADMAACAYAAEGLHVVRTRSFNHTGPGQSTDYVCSRLAKLISEVALGRREPEIEVGNIESVRDFTDVRDVVRAYWLLLQKGNPGEAYNVCNQKAYSISGIINIFADFAGIEIKLKTSSEFLRKSDIPVILGCNEKILNDTGWEPIILFENTLFDLFKFFREQTL